MKKPPSSGPLVGKSGGNKSPSGGKEVVKAKAPPQAKRGGPSSPKTVPARKFGFFEDRVPIDQVADEDIERVSLRKLHGLIFVEAVMIMVLACGFVVGQPIFQPIYRYYAMSPEAKTKELLPLPMPNMTNQAVLAWASSGVTEMMTIGFGNFSDEMLAQRWRFTQEGWNAFVTAFLSKKVDESFQKNQLVLTTVPRDTPVIVSQGENSDHVYQWKIEIPIIMTFATNDNVSKRDKGIVRLTIVRSNRSPAGIAIESWQL